jgi:hypothetical protein
VRPTWFIQNVLREIQNLCAAACIASSAMHLGNWQQKLEQAPINSGQQQISVQGEQ